MIDINTLHIGSHVLIDGQRREIFGLGCGRVSYLPHPLSSVAESVLADSVEPIPITEELLTELGFINTSSTRRIVYTKGCEYDGLWVEVRNLKDRWEVFVSNNDWDGRMAVRYLHELEAFLYLTTKTELIKE